MINVGTIGTSWITEEFIRAMKLTRKYHLKCVYSRNIATAKDVATKYRAEYYTSSLQNLLFDPSIDLIYIASPNSLHHDHALKAIKAGKHVIVEKPAFANVKEWNEVFDEAKKQNVLVFEAALHYHNRNYRRLSQLISNLKQGHTMPFLGANFNIGQYSSRYELYNQALENKEDVPNIFNPDFSGGTLMDLGVYPIYVALDLFGLPKSLSYNAVKGENGIDLFGNVCLKYDGSQINIFMSKAVHSELFSEIYFDDETVLIENISKISSVKLINTTGQLANVIDYKPENPMYDELIAFSEVINDSESIHQQVRYENWKQLSLQVTTVMQYLRRSAELDF